MKARNWKRTAIAMTIGALISCIPGKFFADEMFVEDVSVIFAEDIEEGEEFLELETEGFFENPEFYENEEVFIRPTQIKREIECLDDEILNLQNQIKKMLNK